MKKTKEQLEKEKKALEKKIELINNKIKDLSKPVVIGFNYPNRII